MSLVTFLAAIRAATDLAMRSYFFNSTIVDWQIIIPNFGIVQGPFQIISLDFGAKHDGEVTFDLALASAGQLSFTAI